MSPVINEFDPLSLLSVDERDSLNEISIKKIRSIILNKLWDFLIIKLSEDLDDQQLEEVLNKVSNEQKYAVLKKYLSDLDEKISRHLDQFKKDYQNYE